MRELEVVRSEDQRPCWVRLGLRAFAVPPLAASASGEVPAYFAGLGDPCSARSGRGDDLPTADDKTLSASPSSASTVQSSTFCSYLGRLK